MAESRGFDKEICTRICKITPYIHIYSLRSITFYLNKKWKKIKPKNQQKKKKKQRITHISVVLLNVRLAFCSLAVGLSFAKRKRFYVFVCVCVCSRVFLCAVELSINW